MPSGRNDVGVQPGLDGAVGVSDAPDTERLDAADNRRILDVGGLSRLTGTYEHTLAAVVVGDVDLRPGLDARRSVWVSLFGLACRHRCLSETGT